MPTVKVTVPDTVLQSFLESDKIQYVIRLNPHNQDQLCEVKTEIIEPLTFQCEVAVEGMVTLEDYRSTCKYQMEECDRLYKELRSVKQELRNLRTDKLVSALRKLKLVK